MGPLLGSASATVVLLRWGRRPGGGRPIQPTCARCGYDVSHRPAGAVRCSECGADLSRPRTVLTRSPATRSWVLGPVGLVAAVAALVAVRAAIRFPSTAYVSSNAPLSWIIAHARRDWGSSGDRYRREWAARTPASAEFYDGLLDMQGARPSRGPVIGTKSWASRTSPRGPLRWVFSRPMRSCHGSGIGSPGRGSARSRCQSARRSALGTLCGYPRPVRSSEAACRSLTSPGGRCGPFSSTHRTVQHCTAVRGGSARRCTPPSETSGWLSSGRPPTPPSTTRFALRPPAGVPTGSRRATTAFGSGSAATLASEAPTATSVK